MSVCVYLVYLLNIYTNYNKLFVIKMQTQPTATTMTREAKLYTRGKSIVGRPLCEHRVAIAIDRKIFCVKDGKLSIRYEDGTTLTWNGKSGDGLRLIKITDAKHSGGKKRIEIPKIEETTRFLLDALGCEIPRVRVFILNDPELYEHCRAALKASTVSDA